MSSSFSINPLIQLNLPLKFRANTCLPPLPHIFNTHTRVRNRKSRISCTGSDNSQNKEQQQQQLNLSVLRFTLGIPGLDESNLPKWIGYAFGSLLLLNHFVGSDSNTITPAQLRTEALGLSLAAFSVVVPFLGKFVKGASSVDQPILPEGSEQLFIMSQNISDTIKEDLAWGTYILLRNTNTVSVLKMHYVRVATGTHRKIYQKIMHLIGLRNRFNDLASLIWRIPFIFLRVQILIYGGFSQRRLVLSWYNLCSLRRRLRGFSCWLLASIMLITTETEHG